MIKRHTQKAYISQKNLDTFFNFSNLVTLDPREKAKKYAVSQKT